MALTLKYRPKSFAEVVGQNAVVSILSRQLATNSWKHCYLFSGCFGSGKTTCARIFANELNHGEGEPIEIDAASHNSVDDIRAVIADAQQSSIDSDYRIYIWDECQLLTNQAWNAALKLFEEPPSHVVFILCTTNPEKIPDTILSRVQRFDFKRVPSNLIADRLEYIMNEEAHSNYERLALERIAGVADGHLRDAVSLLERCLDIDENITLELVETTLGLVRFNSIVNIYKNALSNNAGECIKEINELREHSVDMFKVYDELVNFVTDSAIYSITKDIDTTAIPKEYERTLCTDKDKVILFMKRLMEYRKYIDKSNAELFIKTVCVEMCEG